MNGEKESNPTPAKPLHAAVEVVGEVERAMLEAEEHFEKAIDPLRKSALERFPTLFLLAVTFGVTSTALGMEQLLFRFEILRDNPLLILVLGILVLAMTGTFYKKLG